MSLYVCRACRTRLIAIAKHKSVHIQLRTLSTSAALLQNEPEEYHQDLPPPGRKAYTHPKGDTRSDQTVNHAAQISRVAGRYSSRALKPQELLNELSKPPPIVHVATGQHPISEALNDIHNPRRHSGPMVRKPDAVERLRRAVLTAAATNDPNSNIAADIWPALLAALHDPSNKEGIDELRRLQPFRLHLQKLSRLFRNAWLRQIPTMLHAMDHNDHSLAQPTQISPAQVLRLQALFDKHFHTDAISTVWCIACSLSELYGSAPGRIQNLSQYEKECFKQLMSIWQLYMASVLRLNQADGATFSQRLAKDLQQPSSMDWSFLPELDQEEIGTLDDMLSLMVGSPSSPTQFSPLKAPHTDRPDTASAVLLTLDLVRTVEKYQGGEELIQQNQRWLQLMGDIVDRATHRRVPRMLAAKFASSAPDSALHRHYRDLIERLRLDAAGHGVSAFTDAAETISTDIGTEEIGETVRTDSVEKTGTAEVDGKKVPPSQILAPSNAVALRDRITYLSIKRLGSSIDQDDYPRAEKVRQDVFRFTSQHPEIQLPLQLYEHLLLAFLSLRRLDIAIECWKSMVAAGHRPSVKTYTVAIRHSQYLKSGAASEYFWNQLRQDGLQPDAHAWNARVLSLLNRGQIEQGIRALAQMGHEWISMARKVYRDKPQPSKKVKKATQLAQDGGDLALAAGDINGIPKPSIHVMNVAIGVLASKGRQDMIPKVLAWGRQFGIEPDVHTYNSLMNISMRNGAPGEATDLLRRMKEKNIEANDDTWTVLLSAVFESGSLDNLGAREQEGKLMTLIQSLEAANGATLGPKGYALILDRVLKRYNNPRAAQSVLKHMSSRGAELTKYHYTILMTAYFAQHPPNFAAISALWNQIDKGKYGYSGALGSQFYDRMIEGYATHHNLVGIQPMMSFLERAESEGKMVSWTALKCIVLALAERSEWHQLSRLVNNVRSKLREREVGHTFGGQREFWELVISTGILNKEGIDSPHQIERESAGLDRFDRRASRPLPSVEQQLSGL